MIPVDNNRLPMRDGVVLTADVVIPANGPTPTLLVSDVHNQQQLLQWASAPSAVVE